jgi:P4 family phage/plasmid primase-like protien
MIAPVSKFGKIFIWYGSGANGKSLLLNIMENIMGSLLTHSNILNINDKFALEDVMNGIANVTDDVGITTLKETGILKSLVDGSTIDVNRKYKTPVKWKPDSQFVMCCNELPRIADTTRGMIRRLSFIPFDMQLRDEDIDIFLLDKILADKNNLRYILSGAVYAYRDAINAGHLTKLDKQQELTDDFIEENKEPISAFYDWIVDDCNGIGPFGRWIDGKTTEEMYSTYKKWCENNQIKVETQRTFTTRFGKKLPANVTKKVVKLGGQVFNVYQLLV